MMTMFFQKGSEVCAGHRLEDGEPRRHRSLRRFLLEDDRPRHLPAVQPIRGALLLEHAHTDADIDATINAASEVLGEIAAG
jgi:hypothetical protein